MVGIINDEKAEKDAKAACESKFAASSDGLSAAKDGPTVKMSVPTSTWPSPFARRIYPEVVHIHPTPANGTDRGSADVRTPPSEYSGVFPGTSNAAFLNSYHAGTEKDMARSSAGELPLEDFGPAAYGSGQARRYM